jgi:hypothetical protein
MQYPQIPKIDGAVELLEMLLDPKKTAARLKAIQDATEIHNQGLQRWEAFKTVEQYKSQVDGELADAKAEIADAKEYAAKTRQQAEALLGKATATARMEAANSAEVRKNAEQQKTALDLREKELAKREEATARDLAKAEQFKEDGKRLLTEANQIKAEYERKLLKIKEMAA